MKTCPVCLEKFDPMWRIEIDAEMSAGQLAGVLAQIIYCSTECKRKKQNQDSYRKRIARRKS